MSWKTVFLAKGVVVAALLQATSAANAADLGGDCCLDLEERIAELEATTARKGNRKVSLTVSGYIAQELTFWDDGAESNVYVHGFGPTQASNVRFHGTATITPDLSAGYMLRLQDLSTNPFARSGADAMTQDNASFGTGVATQFSFAYLQSKSLGKVSIGLQPMAAKGAAMFTDQSGAMLFDNYTFFSGFPQFGLRQAGDLSPVTWGNLSFCYWQNLPIGGDCSGIVMNSVRYDTPVMGGFSASASWGDDDTWELAARYAGQHAGFKMSFGIGYSVSTSETMSGPQVLGHKDSSYFQAGGYLEHVGSGVFVHAAYGYEDNGEELLAASGLPVSDGEHWYVKSGIRKTWTPLGATILYGDYAEYIDQLGPAAIAQGATSSTLKRFGGGIAQEIDAAAMTLYVKYQHYEGEVKGAPTLSDLDDLKLLSTGAIINF